MFQSISIAGTGMNVYQTWIDTIGGNVANMQDAVTPGKPVYRAQEVVAAPQAASALPGGVGVGQGVQITQIALGPKGTTVYDPTSAAANPQGLVVQPNVNLGHELVSLTMAQSGYQANAAVLSHAQAAYQAALNIHV